MRYSIDSLNRNDTGRADHVVDETEQEAQVSQSQPVSAYHYPPSAEEWEQIRPIFTQLYLDLRCTLNAVMQEIYNRYGFRASRKMYKNRITAWGLERNLRQHEVEHILGIRAQRSNEGKDTLFLLRGRPVDMDLVYRYLYRKRERERDVISRYNTGQSKRCADLEPYTPQWTPATTLSRGPSEDHSENCLMEFQNLVDGLLDCRRCVVSEDSIQFEWTDATAAIRNFRRTNFYKVVTGLREGDASTVRRFALLLEGATDCTHAYVLMEIFFIIAYIASSGLAEIASALLRHIQELIRYKLTPLSAQHGFLKQMAELDVVQLVPTYMRLHQLRNGIECRTRHERQESHFLSRYLMLNAQLNLGIAVDEASFAELLQNSITRYGRASLYTLSLLLCTTNPAYRLFSENSVVQELVNHLMTSARLTCSEAGLMVDDEVLIFQAAWKLADFYGDMYACELQQYCLTAMMVRYQHTMSVDDIYEIALDLDQLANRSHIADGNLQWRELIRGIEASWKAELDAADMIRDVVPGYASNLTTQATFSLEVLHLDRRTN